MRRAKRNPNSGQTAIADIAMLLLIFFLVTTQIDEEKGITTELPPRSVSKSNHPLTKVSILVNQRDEVLLDKQKLSIEEIDQQLFSVLKQHAGNIQVELKSHVGTSYPAYVKTYDEIKTAYHLLYDDFAQRQYGRSFNNLTSEQQSNIAKATPIKIFEGDLVE